MLLRHFKLFLPYIARPFSDLRRKEKQYPILTWISSAYAKINVCLLLRESSFAIFSSFFWKPRGKLDPWNYFSSHPFKPPNFLQHLQSNILFLFSEGKILNRHFSYLWHECANNFLENSILPIVLSTGIYAREKSTDCRETFWSVTSHKTKFRLRLYEQI